jgi:hypothetical protein
MANPTVSISAVSSIGANYATLNGSVTPNATSRTWWACLNPATLADVTESISDTEYFWEFVDSGSASPIVVEPVFTSYGNITDYPPATTHVLGSGSSPIALATVVYGLASVTDYTVRLIARRILYPGTGSGLRYKRTEQPYEDFHTTTVSFTTL